MGVPDRSRVRETHHGIGVLVRCTHPTIRRGISLMEVLISIFVLSIGMLGVAALIPVGRFSIVETSKADRGAACGQAAQFNVVKTALARRSFAEIKSLSPLAECLKGPTGVAYGVDDPVLLARTLADWGKKEQVLRLKGGVLSGRPLGADDVAALAKIPPRPILMAQVVGTIAAPIRSLLAVAQGPIRKLLGLAEALAKKKEELTTDEHG